MIRDVHLESGSCRPRGRCTDQPPKGEIYWPTAQEVDLLTNRPRGRFTDQPPKRDMYWPTAQGGDLLTNRPRGRFTDQPPSGRFTDQPPKGEIYSRRLIRSSRPTEIFQPPQQGFFSVHAQLQLLGNIFQLFTPHPTLPQLTSHLTMLTLWFYI
jgi:hypothetical protein